MSTLESVSEPKHRCEFCGEEFGYHAPAVLVSCIKLEVGRSSRIRANPGFTCSFPICRVCFVVLFEELICTPMTTYLSILTISPSPEYDGNEKLFEYVRVVSSRLAEQDANSICSKCGIKVRTLECVVRITFTEVELGGTALKYWGPVHETRASMYLPAAKDPVNLCMRCWYANPELGDIVLRRSWSE